MSEKQLVLVATIRAKPGTRDRLRSAFVELERHSRTEQGCIKYDLHQSMEDDDIFLFYEIWSGEDALGQHASSQFMMESQKVTRELIESVSLQKFQLVS